jgi:hypothetical protein
MSIAEYLVAVQTNGTQGPSINSTSTEILVIALIAVLLGFMVWIFIRTSSKRSTKS